MKKIISLVLLGLLISSQAMAAVTYSVAGLNGPYVSGSKKMASAQLTLAGTYASNGFALNAADFGMSHIESVLVQSDTGLVPYYKKSTGKILVYRTAATTPAGTVASTFTGTGATITPTAAFTGSAMGNHQHADTAAFTGSADTITPTATFSGTPDTISPTASASAPTFTASGTTSNYISLLGDVVACANTDNENADGAEIASADAVAAYSAVAAGAWAVGAITAPDYSRNVAITIKNGTGGPLNLFEGVMTFTVSGTAWNDAAQTEDITFTSTALNKAIAAGQFRAKYGVKAFKTVTSVTLDNVPDNGLEIGVGKGGKVSLHGTLKTPAEGDMLQVVEDGSVLVITGNVDTTNMTFNFDTIAASKVIQMAYQTVDGSSGTVSAPTITVTGAAYTPAGTVNVTGAAYTPAGTVAITPADASAGTPAGTVAVTGASYTPEGTVASTFTGSATAQASLAEVTAGVSVAGSIVNVVVTGW